MRDVGVALEEVLLISFFFFDRFHKAADNWCVWFDDGGVASGCNSRSGRAGQYFFIGMYKNICRRGAIMSDIYYTWWRGAGSVRAAPDPSDANRSRSDSACRSVKQHRVSCDALGTGYVSSTAVPWPALLLTCCGYCCWPISWPISFIVVSFERWFFRFVSSSLPLHSANT